MIFLIENAVQLASLVVALCALIVTYLAVAKQHKPHILIYYQVNLHQASIIDLVIENIGSGFAFNISFDQPLKCYLFNAEEGLNDKHGMVVFRNGIPYLSAGQKLVVLGGQFAGIESWVGEGKLIKITASYKNPFSIKRESKSTCCLQVNHLKGLPTRKSGDQAIVDAFRNNSSSVFYKIYKVLEKMNHSLSSMNNRGGGSHLDK